MIGGATLHASKSRTLTPIATSFEDAEAKHAMTTELEEVRFGTSICNKSKYNACIKYVLTRH